MTCLLELWRVAFGHGWVRPERWTEVEAGLGDRSVAQQRKAWKACAKMSFQGKVELSWSRMRRTLTLTMAPILNSLSRTVST